VQCADRAAARGARGGWVCALSARRDAPRRRLSGAADTDRRGGGFIVMYVPRTIVIPTPLIRLP